MSAVSTFEQVQAVLRSSQRPMRAAEIAHQLGASRREVNSVLHAHQDVIFSKAIADFTWMILTNPGMPRDPGADQEKVTCTAYFAPDGNPIAELCKLIRSASSSVVVQAYYLRSAPIANALLEAHKSGRSVRILLGSTSNRSKTTRKLETRHGGKKHAIPLKLHNAGIEIREDCADTNNHNKCMVIDEIVTVTGGLNFCDYAADNADNMVVIRSAAVARQFLADWKRNFEHHGEPFVVDEL